jgi:16S rRNA (cytosine967-C5)-methyltransferase
MIAPARQAAYEVLRAVTSGRADLPAALARARTRLVDERDRALAGEIAAGTLRWMGAFDHVIAAFARRPVARLDPEVLDILRLSAFQLLHLDRIPASAAVNDAVSLTRKAGKASAAGLVNALLRRVARERDALPLPRRPADPVPDREGALAYLSITLSHPVWLVERWLARYGFEAAEAWARFDNAPAALMLRANALVNRRDELATELAAEGVVTEAARFAPDALVVRSGNPLLTPLAGTGRFVVQDEASQLVALLAAPRPGAVVLDACASPGGKTTAMAAMTQRHGRIVACDVRERRVALLAGAVAEAGASNVRIVQADVARALPFGPVFDVVLLDAPCSGLGTLRRDPEIRWRRRPDELPRLAAVQRSMLARVVEVLKPGGRLVYATCSSEPDENEEVVAHLLGDDARVVPAAPEAFPEALGRFRTAEGYFRTLPFRDGLEAFFAAMLVKTKDLR